MRRIRPGFAWWPVVAACLGSVPACGPRVAIEDLPTARETIARVGKRLGQAKAPGELTEAARDGDRVLRLLTRDERYALGRDAIRFRVDRPTIVDIAATVGSVPFWLADQGFVATSEKLRDEDGPRVVYRKSFPAGTIGLGVNALDRSSPSHYAVFLRADAGGVPRVERIAPSDLTTVIAAEGVSPHADAFKPFEAIPPALLGSLVLQTRHEQRHDGLLATGRVWKARQPSGPMPDQVVVSFGEDPRTALSFTWRTDPSVKTSAIRISRDGDRDAARTLQGDAHPVESDGLLNDPTILRHRVVAEGLEPDTIYNYAVGDGSERGWSGWHSVRTAPSKLRDFGFLYLGDAQCGLERWGELLHAARRHRPDAGFLLLAGDLVDRGNERTNWDHFFLRAAGVFEAVPFMPAVGNHEYLDKGPMIYRGTFDLPRNGPPGIDSNLVYSFEYSDAFVAVLDSNLGIYDSRLARVQAEWLDEALTRTRATWKFVTFHHPVYASHVSRENPELAAAWGPVFDKHHVDMVLQGHDHAYLRTRPMREGRGVASPAEGTVYVVSVSGEKFYEQDARDYTEKGMTNLATYQTLDVKVKERRLTYRSFDRDGREVDALVIEKGGEGARLAGSAP
jgi:Purple acid Phosphatase, N-terminal domain/Calcineurin-like phosphoesterase